jgi:Asp-tRNA(Asn)/Glu-tRNA(Gln) amidotransferase A subunit family amidase
MDLTKLTAVEAAAGIRRGDFTSEALVVACLKRIAEREPDVQAWAHLDEAYALAQARAADTALRAGQALGSLHGVPVGIKDIIDTARLPTENGTSIFAGRQPKEDASVVHQLKAAGAVILGKTVTTELAFFGPGKTRNPVNPEHTPGGSSSGSAAAVADFHVPLALGTQTAGSILRPASYCGSIGWKPTFGLISRTGVLAQSPPLDTVGAFARSVEDVALITDCMVGADPSDSDMGPRPKGSPLEELRAAPDRQPRLAFVKSPAWPQGEEAMQKAFAQFVAGLGAAVVEEVELPGEFVDTGGLQRAVQFRDIAKNYGPIADAHPGQISAKLAEVIAVGSSVTDTEYGHALARRAPLYVALGPLLSRFDAILTPAAAGPAPKGLGSTGSPAFNFLWTYLGMPAISLPLLEAGGLPLGVQLVGRRDEDGRLLAAARDMIRA